MKTKTTKMLMSVENTFWHKKAGRQTKKKHKATRIHGMPYNNFFND